MFLRGKYTFEKIRSEKYFETKKIWKKIWKIKKKL